ncbi:MAG: zinc-ribbon domain-containing protein [Lactobacillus sp.]|jgi:RNA polymerase subunit RPABC4/transcription elongation factor Spt4|nr:zinc-ribbon domain-containing protein [Lactobacillus sp.]
MKFCQNCGKQVLDTAKFCPYCGAKIAEATASGHVVTDPVEPKTSVGATDKFIQQPEVPDNNSSQAESNTNNWQDGGKQQSFETGQNDYANTSTQGQTVYLNQAQLGFFGSVGYAFKYGFKFTSGPAESRKSVFWWLQLFEALVGLVFLALFLVQPFLAFVLSRLFGLVMLLPTISAIMRRLKYLGKNPYLAWLMLVLVANIVVIVWMLESRVEPVDYQ